MGSTVTAAHTSEALWAVVLAAGASRRLGHPKQLLCWRDDTLVAHAVRSAQSACPARVLLVLGAYAARIESALADSRLATGAARIVHNAQWAEGMGVSLRAGIAALPAQCAGALLLTCDQPLVPHSALTALVARWRADPTRAVASAYAGTAGVPAIVPARLFPTLATLSGDRGARAVLRAEGARLETVPVPEAAFDVDDEAAARTLELHTQPGVRADES
jgi:molybdenum cofactor cytidylyltransferase